MGQHLSARRAVLAALLALAGITRPGTLGAQDSTGTALEAPAERNPVVDSARALFRTGETAYKEPAGAGLTRAIAAWEASARLYGQAGRIPTQANVLSWICRARKEAGPPAQALEACGLALRAFEQLDSTARQAQIRVRLGELHDDLKQPDSAAAQFRAAALLYRRVGSPNSEAGTWARVGRAHYAAGRIDSALAAYTTALEQHRAGRDSSGEGTDLRWLGFLEDERDSTQAAIGYYRAALMRYAGFSADTTRRKVHRRLGELFDKLEVTDSSVHHLTRSFGDPPIGTLTAETRAFHRLGDLYIKTASDSAVVYYRAGQRLVDAGADYKWKGLLLRGLAVAFYNTRQLDSAAAAFTRAIQLHRADRDSMQVSSASGWLGKVEADRGDTVAAIAAYREAFAWYPVSGIPAPRVALSGEIVTLFANRGQVDSAAAQTRLLYGSESNSIAELGPGQIDSAIAQLRRSLKPGAASGDPAVRARTLERLADLHWKAGRYDSTVGYRRAAISAYRKAIDSYPAGGPAGPLANLHSAIGWLFEKQGQLDSMSVHFGISVAGGGVSPQSPGQILEQLASRQAFEGRRDSAIVLFQEAARRFEESGSQGLRNTAISRVANLFRDKGQLDSALFYGRLLLADWRRLENRGEEAWTLMVVAGYHLQRDEFDSALVYSAAGLRRMPPNARPRLGASLHGIRGTAFSSTGRYDSALVHHRAAVSGWKSAGATFKDDAARSMGYLGSIFRQLGQFDSALAYHRAQRAMMLSGTVGELAALREIALDFEAAGARDSALSYQHERQQLARFRRENTASDPLGDKRAESDAFERIGLLQLAQGDTTAARAAFASALTSYREAGTEGLDAAALNDLAGLYDRVEEEDSALVYRRKAYDRARETGAGGDESLALAAIGRLEIRRGNLEAGLTSLRAALDRHRAAGSLEVSAGILGNIGYTLRRLPEPDLAGALAAFDTAAVYRAAVRTQAGGDENRLSIGEQFTLPVGEWELAWLARAPESGAEPAAFAALAASERGRAQALLDLMLGTSKAATPGADLAAEGRRLVAATTGRGAGLLSYLVTEDTLITWYIRPGGAAGSPAVTAFKVPVSADALARLAGRWRAALGVDQADVGARLAGTSAGPSLEQVLRTGAAGKAGPAGNHAEIGAVLTRLLLPAELLNAGAGEGEVIIVPHGALTVIPFGALPLTDSIETLGTRYALRYAPSLASLAEVERPPPAPRATLTQRLRRALVVGDPLMPSPGNGSGETLTLAPLPAAAAEGKAVALRLGSGSLTGKAATEAAIRRRMPAAPLIHLATHGYAYADPGRARNSFVALAPDPASDGLLTVGEVLDDPALKLSAELVVLSACQTGLGNLKQAEGTVGLQRAFMARGARSMLVSLWSVSDEATAILMERFYHHWLVDPDQPAKSEALRRAQADLRATRGFEEPRYWAPFQLVGGR